MSPSRTSPPPSSSDGDTTPSIVSVEEIRCRLFRLPTRLIVTPVAVAASRRSERDLYDAHAKAAGDPTQRPQKHILLRRCPSEPRHDLLDDPLHPLPRHAQPTADPFRVSKRLHADRRVNQVDFLRALCQPLLVSGELGVPLGKQEIFDGAVVGLGQGVAEEDPVSASGHVAIDFPGYRPGGAVLGSGLCVRNVFSVARSRSGGELNW